MGRSKIGEFQVENHLTGEYSHKSYYINRYTEKFIMVRTTDGLDWFFELGKNEKSLALMLHNWSEPTNMRVSLSGWQRDEICLKLGINRRQISLVLKRLIEKDCLKRINQNDFMVNPAHAFKCEAKQVKSRIETYNFLKSK